MNETAVGKTKRMIGELWTVNGPRIHERLALLDRASGEAAQGALAIQTRQEAVCVAHSLSGSLGMFGFREGTRLALEIEQELGSLSPRSALLSQLTSELRQVLFPLEHHES